MKYLKKIGIFVFVFLSCWLLQFSLVNAVANAQTVTETPVVVNTNLSSPHTRQGRPIITGLAPKGVDVYIYIDGKFAGEAKINESQTGTNNFYYQPVLPLSVGSHTVYTVAKDRQTRILSDRSADKTIIITKLAAPTVYKPNEDTVTGNNRPLMSGLTKSGTRVLIYIDGVYNGKTEIVNHESGTAGFVYKPFLHLGVGEHKYFAIAETINGIRGEQSRTVSFNIEERFPAPTLLSLIDGNKVKLTGLAKNNSKIQVYLDKKLQGEFRVANHESGTANFYFTLQQPLTKGHHMVYAVAIDQRGKESIWSNVKFVNRVIVATRVPVITEKAASETVEKNNQSVIIKNEIENKIENNSPSEKNNVLNNEKTADENVTKDTVKAESNKGDILSEILGTSTSETKASSTGIVDEERNSQSKLKSSLVIFILFLLALVAWIFWVNRELIKEKKERESSSENKSDENEMDKK